MQNNYQRFHKECSGQVKYLPPSMGESGFYVCILCEKEVSLNDTELLNKQEQN